MIRSTSYKSKQFWWLVFKLVILVLLGYFIYHTLANNSELSFEAFQKTLSDSAIGNPLTVLILIGFTLINWTLEIFKWKILSNSIKAISFKDAATQSLASHAFALITPNRIGEYGAKALYYPRPERKNILVLNFIGNFHQLIATVFLGVIGLLYWKSQLKEELPEIYYDVLTGLLVFSVFIVSILRFISKRYRNWLEGVYKHFQFVTLKLNVKTSLLSLLRYVIFAHQFYFLILSFDIEISYLVCMASIASMYLLSSIIPMLSVFDFVIKGSVAVFVFSFLDVSPLIILTITTLMWILNFVLPAIVGSYFVLKFKPIES